MSFNLVSSIVSFVLRLLGIPARSFSLFSIWRPDPRRHLALDPASAADRWVRELEEETGAVRGGRTSDVGASQSGVSTGAEAGPGPSTLSRRNERLGESHRLLPDFQLSSYDAALRLATRECKVLCVVLVSGEHDDDSDFKRSTLTDPEFNDILRKEEILVWGGDVRDREAHQASQKLSATTYPFVAFVALQLRQGPRSAAANTTADQCHLVILSRHQGPSIPNSASTPTSALGPTSARALCSHLQNQLLPRVTPFLGRLRAAKREREHERLLREAQDAAFAASARRDRERLDERAAAERTARQEAERQRQEKLEEERRRLAQEKDRKNKEILRLEWLRYARRALVPPEPSGSAGVRVSIRMPNGQRLVRKFSETDTLTALYGFVAIQSIAAEHLSQDDPTSPPAGYHQGEEGAKDYDWGFQLVSSIPRSVISWKAGKSLTEVNELKNGGQLVVETRQTHLGSNAVTNPGDGDYDTEEE
ncbi:hypothetical protein BD410DRAFT_767472 [Rickenella mellea]|uniref:UBX domain-containing protein n=1 Tax=Rickenella mellea TaxID=50990 RepID=A0A4Y7QBN3_9AGAM|nr:hypothetical protein BD410DRAFT_767472 [Rickenella mellea]